MKNLLCWEGLWPVAGSEDRALKIRWKEGVDMGSRSVWSRERCLGSRIWNGTQDKNLVGKAEGDPAKRGGCDEASLAFQGWSVQRLPVSPRVLQALGWREEGSRQNHSWKPLEQEVFSLGAERNNLRGARGSWGPQHPGAPWLRCSISLHFSPLKRCLNSLNPPAAEGYWVNIRNWLQPV